MLVYTNNFKVSPAWTWAVLQQVIISHNSLSWRTTGQYVWFQYVSKHVPSVMGHWNSVTHCTWFLKYNLSTYCKIRQTSMTLFIPYLCPKVIVLTKRNGLTFNNNNSNNKQHRKKKIRHFSDRPTSEFSHFNILQYILIGIDSFTPQCFYRFLYIFFH